MVHQACNRHIQLLMNNNNFRLLGCKEIWDFGLKQRFPVILFGCPPDQNRRQNVFNKIDKAQLIHSVSYFSLGSWSFVWGAKTSYRVQYTQG